MWTARAPTVTSAAGPWACFRRPIVPSPPLMARTSAGTLPPASAPSTPQPGFTLSASPASLAIVQGTSGFSAITASPRNGFTGSVTFSASGLPSGVTASFSSNPDPASTTLTFGAGATAAIGTFTVTITGTSGSLSSTATITLTVNPAGDYTLSASPSSLSVVQGTSAISTITVTPQDGFNGNVSLSASGLPSGVSASFNPSTTANSSTLTLTASSTAATGTVTVTVTGISGSLTKTTTISLAIRLIPTLPSVWSDGDIGSVGVAGSASFANGTCTVSGAGQGTMVTASAGFHFVYQPLAGD